MSNSNARLTFFLVYFTFFAVNMAYLVLSWTHFYSSATNWDDLLKKLIELYSVQLSITLTAVLTKRNEQMSRVDWAPYIAGMVVILAWNINTTWPIVYLFHTAGPQGMDIKWALQYWQVGPALTSFLASAVLTFFLSSNSRESTP